MFNTIHFASDATWPPDGIPTLQDDPGEQGHVKGVQLQPLMSVFVPSTPGAVVQVPVLNARLKKNTRTILICWSQKPINQHIKTPGSASVRNPYIRLWGWPDCKIIVFRLWDSEETLGFLLTVWWSCWVIAKRPTTKTNSSRCVQYTTEGGARRNYNLKKLAKEDTVKLTKVDKNKL